MPVDTDRVQEIFLRALECDDRSERERLIQQECAGDPQLASRVRSLLEAHEKPGELPHVSLTPQLPLMRVGTTIAGRFKLLEQIAEGGMGAVWVAEQTEPVRRRVALKIIKAGMDSKLVLSRFNLERQALALMDHPNIAKVLDGGATEHGRPYFVMEYVKGIPITEYCDEAKLTVRERLKLFMQVCLAVQHAHQKGIIHRDLKPSNILVCLYDGQPIPKVIDFGLAKAMHQPLTENTVYTAHGLMVGTPLYMSPEQAEFNNLDVDTRTDVYSLGVLLYELLTGTTPLERKRFQDAAWQEILRLIKEEDPPRPSTKISSSGSLPTIAAQRGLEPAQLSRLVKGDLDWIVMKALEKERSRRYETASGLARDVERFLSDEPVEACPPSLGYKLRKLVRRNKRALVTAALLTVVIVGALTVAAGSVGWVVRDRQTRQAVVERKILAALDDAKAAIEQDRISDAQVAVRQAEGLLADSEVTGDIEGRVRQWKAHVDMVRSLEEIQVERPVDNEDPSGLGTTAAAYEQAFRDYGLDLDRLDAHQAAERIRQLPIKQYLVAALDDWAAIQDEADMAERGDGGEGRRLLAAAREADDDPWRNRLRDAMERQDVTSLTQLAQSVEVLTQRPVTITLVAQGLKKAGDGRLARIVLRRAQRRHPADFWINFYLGVLVLKADPWESIGYLRTCVARRPTSAGARNRLGMALKNGDYPAEAEAEFREAIRLKPHFAAPHNNLAVLLQSQEKAAEAEIEYRAAMRLNPQSYVPFNNLKQLLTNQGKIGEAEAAFRESIKNNPEAAPAYVCLGDVLGEQNKWAEADAAYQQAIRIDATSRASWSSRRQIAFNLLQDDRGVAAAQYLMQAVEALPENDLLAMQTAILQYRLGNRDAYAKVCGQLLERARDTKEPRQAFRAAKACLISIPPAGGLGELTRLADVAVSDGKDHGVLYFHYLLVRALASYRAADWNRTLTWCAEREKGAYDETLEATFLVLEAMARHRMEEKEKALSSLASARRLIDKLYPQAPKKLGQAWADWSLYEILRKEAETLMPPTGEPDATVDPVRAAIEIEFSKAKELLVQENWDDAAQHLMHVVEARPRDHLLAMQTAALLLQRGNRKGYERVCKLMLDIYGDTQDPIEADRTAKACLLSDVPVGAPDQLMRLAEIATSNSNHTYYRFFVLARALAAYRAEDSEGALAWCSEGLGRIGERNDVNYLKAQYLVVKAMAQKSAGNANGAQTSLKEATTIIGDLWPDAPRNVGGRWADWAIYEVLRKEAESLIGVQPIAPAAAPK